MYKEIKKLFDQGLTTVDEVADALGVDAGDGETRLELERAIRAIAADESTESVDPKKKDEVPSDVVAATTEDVE